MSLITSIDGIPLFTTIQEALQWASENGYQGYHTHIYQGQVGYMGGQNHANVTNPQSTNLNVPNISTGSVTSVSTSSTSSGGGGGGY